MMPLPGEAAASTSPGLHGEGLQARHAEWREAGVAPSQAEAYDAAAGLHEDTLAKAAGLLGTSFAGMVAHDDLAALEVLQDADSALRSLHPSGSYRGSFWPGGHTFTAGMQSETAAFLLAALAEPAPGPP